LFTVGGNANPLAVIQNELRLIGPVSALKTETNARHAIKHRKLEINSEYPRGKTVTVNTLVSRYLE
jgi:hypothetical protein